MAMGVTLNAETHCKPYSPPKVDRIWLWVYDNKIPIYPIFYLLKGDCKPSTLLKGSEGAAMPFREIVAGDATSTS